MVWIDILSRILESKG